MVEVGAFGGDKAKQLFDTLLAARGDVVSFDRLAARLWGEAQPRHVAATLAAYVDVLRNRVQPGAPEAESVIVAEGDGYRFDPSRATQAAPDRQLAG